MDQLIKERLKQLPLGNICDANGKTGSMDMAIKPVNPKSKLAGEAYTVRCHPGDNLAIHRAMLEAPAGSVLVVDAGGFCAAGHFGEIMASACLKKGIAGLVIDGAIRDAQDIEEMGFPVFARGVCANGTIKESIGTIGGSAYCGGVLVHTGDAVIGDRDGVAVIAREKLGEVLSNAEAIAQKEKAVLQLIAEGKTTAQIYGMTKILDQSGEAL